MGASAFELLLCGLVGSVTEPEGGEVRMTVPSGRVGVAVEGGGVAVVEVGDEELVVVGLVPDDRTADGEQQPNRKRPWPEPGSP